MDDIGEALIDHPLFEGLSEEDFYILIETYFHDSLVNAGDTMIKTAHEIEGMYIIFYGGITVCEKLPEDMDTKLGTVDYVDFDQMIHYSHDSTIV
jgi:formylmethanofuran:tetrahydromethanopterin formyltransferase